MSRHNMLPTKPRVAFFDADGTLHHDFSLIPVQAALASNGMATKQSLSTLLEIQTQYQLGKLPYHEFATQGLRETAHGLRGTRLQDAKDVAEKFFADGGVQWFGYVGTTLAKLRQEGSCTLLVTAEPQYIAHGLLRSLGFNGTFSSEFEVDNDCFTGDVASVLGSAQKRAVIEEYKHMARHSIAFGDSEGDIGMLESVDKAYCINPTPLLANHAAAAKTPPEWHIITDLVATGSLVD